MGRSLVICSFGLKSERSVSATESEVVEGDTKEPILRTESSKIEACVLDCHVGLAAREASSRNAFFVAAATAVGILAVDAVVGLLLGLGAALMLRERSPSAG